MGSLPNHPMIVHFPIVLAILLPLFAVGALWVIRSRPDSRRAWAIPLALSVLLFGSAFVATRTGEAEEERVEEVVPERALHEHEEAAERFLVLAGIVAAVALAGMARGITGSAARLVATAGSLVVVFAGYQVGHAGGELVYVHNAGAAYTQAGSQANNEDGTTTERERDDDD
jgi:uncharacterized membrane protein